MQGTSRHVPVHRELPAGTLRSGIRQSGLSLEESSNCCNALTDGTPSRAPWPTAEQHRRAIMSGSLISKAHEQTARFETPTGLWPRCHDHAMESGIERWSIFHFSQSNPAGPGQSDVPALLRRVADSVEALGEVTVQDIVFHDEVTEDGTWPSMTVYFGDEPDGT